MNYVSTQWERLGLISLEPVLRDNGSVYRDKSRTRVSDAHSKVNPKHDGKHFIVPAAAAPAGAAQISRVQDRPGQGTAGAGLEKVIVP